MKNTKNKKIAVCFYGQVRTGDYCKSFISEFLKIDQTEIDIFCSTKNYDIFLRTNGNTKHDVDESDIADLFNYYNPKLQNIISYDDESPFVTSTDVTKDTSLFFSSFVDSIMLKQQYEIMHNFVYDYVIMLRYDTIYEDINYLKKFFIMLDFYIQQNITSSSFVFVNPFTYKGITTSDWINDVIIVGTNEAINLICAQLINFYIDINQKFKYSTFLTPATGLDNGHIGLGYAIQQMCVNKYYFSDVMSYPLILTNVRQTADLTLDPLDASTFYVHQLHHRDSFKK
jgi:hypothetical protein